jgi:NADPH-dependent 2,4-dienoyl-CoA reductase/sulfur reductase-like enzyme
LRWNASFANVDAVVVGVGVQPNTQLASDAGLDVDDGVVVDDRCQTSDPAIFAAGDVTSHPVSGGAFRQRLESWKVASGQSLVAAKSMAGIDSRYAEPPWLWSDQFGHNIQSLGVLRNTDRSVVLDDPETNNWTAIFLDSHDKIAGAIAVNNGRDISMLKRAMLQDGIIPEKLLSRAARYRSR